MLSKSGRIIDDVAEPRYGLGPGGDVSVKHIVDTLRPKSRFGISRCGRAVDMSWMPPEDTSVCRDCLHVEVQVIESD